MIEILLLILVLWMGFKRDTSAHRRKFSRYIRGSVEEQVSLGTLAGQTLTSAVFDNTVNERTFVSSIVATWDVKNFTAGGAIGPLLCGIAHSDYSNAEIEAWVEDSGSWDEGDLVRQEIAKRKIRTVCELRAGATASDGFVANDGKPIRTKLNWIMLQGQTLRLWVFNLGGSAIATTIPIVQCSGHVNLWPR